MAKKETTEIVKTEDVMETFDKLDESQALAELKGAALQEYVYSFMDKGVNVIGLSLVGVRETVREMNKRGLARTGITDKPPIINETDDYIELQTYAKDELNGGGYWGIKRQVKKFSTGTVNRFAMEQALSKAQRNALRGLIPEPFVKEMIATYLKEGKGKDVTPADVKNATSGKGKFPTNREYWDSYKWDDIKDMAAKPPSRGFDADKGKPKSSMEGLKLYFYACDVMPKKNVPDYMGNIINKKSWEYTYEDIKVIVNSLIGLEDETEEEVEKKFEEHEKKEKK